MNHLLVVFCLSVSVAALAGEAKRNTASDNGGEWRAGVVKQVSMATNKLDGGLGHDYYFLIENQSTKEQIYATVCSESPATKTQHDVAVEILKLARIKGGQVNVVVRNPQIQKIDGGYTEVKGCIEWAKY